MLRNRSVAVLASIALVGCAGTPPTVSPLPDASQTVSYERGVATTYSVKQYGAVEVMPLGYDDGRVAFKVAVRNQGDMPANFGVENISVVQDNGSPGHVMTAAQLEHEAQVHATWAKVGMAVAGALGGVAASESAYSTSHTTIHTRFGNASVTTRNYDPAVAYAAGRDVAAETGAGFAAIQSQLDNTINGIEAGVLQTTTLAPGDGYGGIAVVDTLDSSKLPQSLSLQVDWNGETHPFRFYISEDGAVPPPQTGPLPVAAAVTLTAEKSMPIGHASNAEHDAAATAKASAGPMSFQAWQQAPKAASHPATARKPAGSRTGISIVGAVN